MAKKKDAVDIWAEKALEARAAAAQGIKNYAKEYTAAVADLTVKGFHMAKEASAERKKQSKLRHNLEAAEFLKENTKHVHLVLVQDKREKPLIYRIYDETRSVKYRAVDRGRAMDKQKLEVSNTEGKVVGTITQSLIALRHPFREYDPRDYLIEVGGEKLGKIRTKGSLKKRLFEVQFNGWHVEGDWAGFRYRVFTDSGKTIMTMTSEGEVSGDTWYLDIRNPLDEFPCVLLAIVLDAKYEWKN